MRQISYFWLVACVLATPLWGLSQDGYVRTLELEDDSKINSFTISKDNTMLLGAGGNSSLNKAVPASKALPTYIIWDLYSERIINQLPKEVQKAVKKKHKVNDFQYILISEDSKTIICADEETIISFNKESPAIFHGVKTGSPITSLSLSPNGKLLMTGHKDNIIRVWNVSPGNIAVDSRQMRGHYDPVTHLAFHPIGQYLLSAGEDMALRLWEVSTGKPVKIYRGFEQGIEYMDFHPDGSSFMVCDTRGYVITWDLQNQVIKQTLRPSSTSRPYSLKYHFANFGPKGKQVITINEGKRYKKDRSLFLAIQPTGNEKATRTQIIESDKKLFEDDFSFILAQNGTKLFIHNQTEGTLKAVEIPEYDIYQIQPDLASNPVDNENNIVDPIAVEVPKINGKQDREKDLAIIIANQDYQKTNEVEFAIQDGKVMKDHLIQTLGFEENNVIMIQDVGINELETWLGNENNPNGKLSSLIKARQGEGQVFLYYMGHGVPGSDSTSYLLTIDGDPSNPELSGGYSLKTLYKNLAQYEASLKVVMIDACFSGQQVEYPNQLGRPVPKLKQSSQSYATDPNLIVLSAAKDDETAASFPPKQHSLFTFWILRAMHDVESVDTDANGEVSYQELFYYISDPLKAIPYYAQRSASSTIIQQHPQIMGKKLNATFFQYK